MLFKWNSVESCECEEAEETLNRLWLISKFQYGQTAEHIVSEYFLNYIENNSTNIFKHNCVLFDSLSGLNFKIFGFEYFEIWDPQEFSKFISIYFVQNATNSAQNKRIVKYSCVAESLFSSLSFIWFCRVIHIINIIDLMDVYEQRNIFGIICLSWITMFHSMWHYISNLCKIFVCSFGPHQIFQCRFFIAKSITIQHEWVCYFY